MASLNVLVVFYSRYGRTERLALAAGVGAIQARGSLRLRRVADLAAREVIDASAAWRDNLDRMNRDYVTPRPADADWADVIVLGTPADTAAEIEGYCAWLRSTGTMAGKVAAPLSPGGGDSALATIYAAAACAGMIVAPQVPAGDEAAAREHGRRVTEMARALKESNAVTTRSDSTP